MSTEPVLIVGAGPTGLVLALRLARHGVAFRLIDKAAGPGLASRAMAVHARTLEFYRQIGFGDEMARRGVRIETALVREGGAERTRLSLRDIGTGLSPYPFVLAFPQDDHERFLGERLAAAGGAVEWGVALESFTQTDSRVEAVLDNKGARETAAFAYVCGCDGAHSRVRETLRLGFPGGTYQHLHYVADARLAGTPDEDLYVNIGAESFALNLPVRSSGMHRLIGIAPEEAGRALTFDDVRPQAERLLGVRVASVNWFSTYRVHHRVASRFRAGRGFIAGDAGHVHSPVGGQGMNTGIGDAVNLAWKIAAVLQGRAGPALLDTYEAERIPFARRLIATTDRVFQAIVSEGLDGQAVRRLLLPYGLPALARIPALRRAFFTTLSQIGIAYRGSALSAGRAGRVRGGDRLPYAADGASDNFAPLANCDWQLHVYGAAAPEIAAAAASLDLPLHAFAWSKVAARAGFEQGAAYLVRPDGYVALALPAQEIGALRAYAGRHWLRFDRADAARAIPDGGATI